VAQLATTTVQDVVYRADGTPAGGSVVISWNAFTTGSGVAVTAGSTTVTLATGGMLTVALAPNAGSVPMGSYYTAVFHLNDGTTTREYWVVPVVAAGGGPAKLAAISTPVLPVSVAMQTVSKAYVDQAIAAAEAGLPATGTIDPARLPLFGPSGTAHAAGIVPDPGPTAGATRYLREDGAWSAPSTGSGGSPAGAAGGDLAGSYPNPTVTQAQNGAVGFVSVSGGSYGQLTLNAGSTGNHGYVGTYNNQIIMAPIRNPATGVYDDLSLAAPIIVTSALNGDSFIALETTNLNDGSPTNGLFINGAGQTSIGPHACLGGTCAGLFNVGSSDQFHVDGSGNMTSNTVIGPAVLPTGSCTIAGAWAFSQDGHAAFCNSGSWVTKI